MFSCVIMLISNTSTLVLLAKVDALLPFFEIAPQISIPQEVHIETIAKPDSLDCKLIQLCKLEQIPFLCALSVIIRLYEKKMLTRQEALDKLQLLQKIGRYARE